MSLPVAQKVRNGERLTEEEVQYAFEHGIALPEEYGTPKVSADQPVVQTGPAFAGPPSGTGRPRVILLDKMRKGQLEELAAEYGIVLEGTSKSEMQAELYSALSSGDASSGDESPEEEPSE